MDFVGVKVVLGQPIPGRRKERCGLYAAGTSIKAGECILSETPLLGIETIVAFDDVNLDVMKGFFERVQNLDEVDRRFLHGFIVQQENSIGLLSADDFAREIQDPTLAVAQAVWKAFSSFSYPFTPNHPSTEQLLFRYISQVYHSCVPNATVEWDDEKRVIHLRATTTIGSNEAIAISYIDSFQDRDKRHTDLGFVCGCPACESPDFEKFLAERGKELQIVHEFRSFWLRDLKQILAIVPVAVVQAMAGHPRLGEVVMAAREFVHTLVRSTRNGLRWPDPRVAEVYAFVSLDFE